MQPTNAATAGAKCDNRGTSPAVSVFGKLFGPFVVWKMNLQREISISKLLCASSCFLPKHEVADVHDVEAPQGERPLARHLAVHGVPERKEEREKILLSLNSLRT